MGLLAWVIMGLALWHFTIWLPDRYWGGIVGAFIGALAGAIIFGFLVSGLVIPGRHATHITTSLEAIPGALIGIALVYLEGVRRERRNPGSGLGVTTQARPATALSSSSSRPGPSRTGRPAH
jgi:hypothetical protein